MVGGLMRQLAKTKISLLLLLSLAGAAAQAEPPKKKVAGLPLPIMSQSNRAAVTVPISASQIKAAVRNTYPANHMQKGLLAKQNGDFKKALLEFILAVQENPRQTKAFYEQALIFRQRGNTKLAISALEQALAISPAYSEARNLLAQLHLSGGNVVAAAAEAGKVLYFNTVAPEPKAPVVEPAPTPSFVIDPVKPTVESEAPAADADPAKLSPAVAEALAIAAGPQVAAAPVSEPPIPPSLDLSDLTTIKTDSKKKKFGWARIFKRGDNTKSGAKPEKPPIEQTEEQEEMLSSWVRNIKGFFAKPAENKPQVVAASIPLKPAREPESKYGLLEENVSKNIDVFAPETLPLDASAEDETTKPTFLQSLWKQATATLSGFVPDFKTVEEVAPEKNSPKPLPMDIAGIFKKLGNVVPTPALRLAKKERSDLPQPSAINLERERAPLPKLPDLAIKQLRPMALPTAMDNKAKTPELPVAPLQKEEVVPALPQAIQEILSQTETVLPKAMQAANTLAEALLPQPVPIAKTEQIAPEPVQLNRPLLENKVPAPVAAAMNSYFEKSVVPTTPLPPVETAEPEKSPSSGLTVLTNKNTKSGAFSYMKPIVDTDQSCLVARNQLRTITPSAAKTAVVPPLPPEDAISKRMRYLLEHGTQNLKPGEAFMYSEQTGEGQLFMPDGHSERRKLAGAQDAETVLRARRPDIMEPKDLQYSLSLLGRLLPAEQPPRQVQQEAVSGPTLEQLMNQSSQGIWSWLKNTFKL
ncbi:MAG: tetratricopeptide repeat protein [Candidatus Obscuribacterales bacterium]|nr:tetratricopeptide repeat protein [Candidatus Obscuribacterales bacterium]